MEGYLVTTPSNHHMKDLLQAIQLERPHIVLVDVNLAKGSGLDLVRSIRKRAGANRYLYINDFRIKFEKKKACRLELMVSSRNPLCQMTC